MKENRKMSLLGKLVVILSCIFLAVCALAVYIYMTPLAEPMTLVDDSGTAPLAAVAGENKAKSSAPKTQEVCGNSGSMLVMFAGEDFKQGVWPLGADTVRVVKLDFSNRKIIVVGFPRDLWVETPALADQDLPETRLGLSYHYKKEATNGSDKHKITVATAQVAQALVDNFGLVPEKYFTIQLQNTPAMIDTIGGLDINVPEAFTSQYGVSFAAGPQHMDGATVAEYVRGWNEENKENDLFRLPRQNILIQALQDKVVSADIITKVPELYKQFDKAIVTDLSPKQIADFACMAKEVPQENIEFHEIAPTDLAAEGDKDVLIPNVEKIKAALKLWLDL